MRGLLLLDLDPDPTLLASPLYPLPLYSLRVLSVAELWADPDAEAERTSTSTLMSLQLDDRF